MNKLLKRLFIARGYEVPQLRPGAFRIQQQLFHAAEPRIIFDVGGHFGETVCRYKALFPRATIYSFEPFAESFIHLERTAAEYADVHAQRLALSDRAGVADFHLNVGCATNSLLPVDAQVSPAWGRLIEPQGATRVPTETLDAFCDARGIRSIDILKIDVQGAEPMVLRGAQDMLRRGAVKLVYTEILTAPCYTGQSTLHELLSLLDGCGFALHNFYDLASSDEGQLKQLDAIFVRNAAADAAYSQAG